MLILAVPACLLLIWLCTVIGAASVSAGEVNRILLHEIFHLPVDMEGISEGSIAIIRDVRLPRVLLGFLTGAALAVCGACYQGIFKNPMADPYILGISSGAALGAAVGIVLHFSSGAAGLPGTTLLAFAGALLTVLLVYAISRRGKRVPVSSLLLSGIAVNQSLSAFMSLLMLFNQQSMEQIMFWTMGSLNGKGWNQILSILPYVLAGTASLALQLAETRGLRVERDPALAYRTLSGTCPGALALLSDEHGVVIATDVAPAGDELAFIEMLAQGYDKLRA